ncbi:MAG TPA: HAD family acid phosphatase [Kineosporiaceae bacterium]|nr:HAD family acid phosphatase [Kineosporiaceae bacterium]
MSSLSVRMLACLAAGAVATVGGATSASAAPVAARPAAVQVAAAASLPSFSTWIADVTAVTNQASAYLATRLPDSTIKAAIVLDIDNTSLESEYVGGLPTPATPPVLALAKQAKAAGAAVIFVTARPEIIKLLTRDNLKQVGYPNDGLYMRGTFDFSSDLTLKTNARIKIEKAGYTIVANIGNNTTDLAGGHAERTFKLPDYNGQLD